MSLGFSPRLVNVSMLTLLPSMIIQQQIPFTRVTASVPPEMREKLPPELTGILESNVSIALSTNLPDVRPNRT